jgi:hypothetical protein
MHFTNLIALLQDAPAPTGTSTVRWISAALAVVLVIIIILRRKGGKKKEEDEF